MNKLKWIPLNEEIKVDYPMAMDINKNVVQFVHFDKNVVFIFINCLWKGKCRRKCK